MVVESYRAKRTFASTARTAPLINVRNAPSSACEAHDDLRAHRHHGARCRSLLTRQAIAEQLHREASRAGALHHLAYRGACEGRNSHTMLCIGQQCAALRYRCGHSNSRCQSAAAARPVLRQPCRATRNSLRRSRPEWARERERPGLLLRRRSLRHPRRVRPPAGCHRHAADHPPAGYSLRQTAPADRHCLRATHPRQSPAAEWWAGPASAHRAARRDIPAPAALLL